MYNRIIRKVEDLNNNEGRMGSIGDGNGRVWKAIETFQDDEFYTYYLMENISKEEEKVLVPIQRITNFY